MGSRPMIRKEKMHRMIILDIHAVEDRDKSWSEESLLSCKDIIMLSMLLLIKNLKQ